MGTAKAVVFTHVAFRDVDEAERLSLAHVADRFIEDFQPSFQSYLKCHSVGLVYVYVDVGTKIVRRHVEALRRHEEEVQVSLAELNAEQRARNCVKLAVETAQQRLKDEHETRFDPDCCPEFQVIGLPHLTSLLATLYSINPDLIKALAGPGPAASQGPGQFGYDSPKFVEAIIRLARGADSRYAGQPIFRFDTDVDVNEDGIKALMAAVDAVAKDPRARFQFFSGGYGHGPGECHGVPDPINDYAVRVHWLAYPNPNDDARECSPWALNDQGYQFLRDLGEIGATQIPGNEVEMSRAMNDFVRNERWGIRMNRASPQVISGAGLYMSYQAIRTLPPFTNFANLTTWVDDHLKRRLHEALGDIGELALERVPGALFHQDRHRRLDGIRISDIDWAKNQYFERLLRGCLLHALIVKPTGMPGLLPNVITPIVTRHKLPPKDNTLRAQLTPQVTQTAREILEIWQKADYGTQAGQVESSSKERGTKLLNHWAANVITPSSAGEEPRMVTIANSTVEDVIRYVKLVAQWRSYVDAIQQLRPVDAFWLFKSGS